MIWVKWLAVCGMAGACWLTPVSSSAALIAYWDFEGANLAERLSDKSSSPIDHDLTLTGNPTIGTKVGRTALRLDGTGDSARTPGGTGSEFDMGLNSFTVAGWFISNDTTRSGLFAHSDDTSDAKSGYYFDTRNVNGTGGYDGRAILDDGPSSILLEVDDGSTAYSTTVWQHVAMTVNRTTNLAKIYLNGAEHDSETIATLGSLDSGVAVLNFVLGDHPSIAGRDFNGALDDWAVWKGNALPASSILGLYDKTYTPLTAPVPEPSTIALSLLALAGVVMRGRMIRKAN